MPTERTEVEETENAEKKAKGPVRRMKIRWLLAFMVLVALAVGIYTWLEYYRDRVSTDDAQVDGHIIPISSKISGTVQEVLVDDNESVSAGQIIIRIDAQDYQVKVDQAKAALKLAESQANAAGMGVSLTRETTESGTSNSEALLAAVRAEYEHAKLSFELTSTSDLAAARAAVASRRASNDKAQADLARMVPLMEKAEISKQQYDAYQAAARVAESELKVAEEELSSTAKDAEIKRSAMIAAKARVEQAEADLQESKANMKRTDISAADAASAKAAVSQAHANLRAAELQLSYTTILAPEDGVITKKTVQVGQVVQPGQGLLMIVPLHKVWVTANFKETQLSEVHPGQRAEIKVDMYNKKLSGRVDSIAGATGARLSLLPPENATGNYVKVVQRIPVKIVVDSDSSDLVLRPGMNVVATVFTK